jgi:hypothetical protein
MEPRRRVGEYERRGTHGEIVQVGEPEKPVAPAGGKK